MRIPSRSLATLLLAVAVATCSDAPSVAPVPTISAGKSRLALEPVFSKAAEQVYAQRATFAAVDFDRVRVVIVRPPADTVKDTTVVFRPGSPDITLDLTVDVRETNELFTAAIDYANAAGVVFHGEGKVQAHAADEPAPPQQQITVNYVGPGSNVARIAITPKSSSVVAPSTLTFSVTAFDANNAPLSNVPINWQSSDPTIATINASTGALTTTGKRGTVTVTASTPTNLSDNATVTVTLPAAAITLVSGGGQTGKAGSALTQAAVVRVIASDGVGVPGVTVVFAAPTGGKVGTASATTDASGQASTSLTLGGTAGPQAFAAVAAGFSVSISETATPADPAAIVAQSGSGQQDTVKHTLKNPLVVKVTDQFGNAVGGATVTWTRTAGSGTLSGPTSVTGADGLASMTYTLGAVAGTETIQATVAGASTPATFTVQAVSAAPSAIAIVSGSGQTGRALQALALPFVVKVSDLNGSPIGNVTVTWSATNGTIGATTTTDAQGLSSNTFTAGSVVGPASATATVSTPNGPRSVTFTATVQPGVVAQLAITSSPSSGTAGAPLTPALQVALRDAQGNLTNATNAVSVAFGNHPSGSTLSGTLTRNAVNGVATFNDLVIDKVGTGYTLVVSSAGVPSQTTAAFDVVAGGAGSLVIVAGDNQTAAVNTAVATAPSVKVIDGNSNPVPNVAVTFAPATGSGSVAPSTPVTTNAQGIATLTSWTLGQSAGPQSLVVSAAGVPSVTMHATAQAGAAAKLVISTQPSASAQSGVPFAQQPAIQLQDASNNPVSQAGVVVTASIATGGGTLGGTLTATTNASGVATFTNLSITGAAGSRTLQFTASGLTLATSSSITIGAGAATQLVITTQPAASAQSGVPFSPQPVIQLADASNNPVSQAGVVVTASIATGGGTLGGTLTATTDASGVATFTNLAITGAAGSRTLLFTASGLTSATSSSITLGAGAASQLVITTQPPASAQSGVPFSPQPVIQLQDASNNPVSQAGVVVTASIATGAGTLGGTLTATTNASGVATFTNLSITGAAGSRTLLFTASGLTSATSSSITLGAGAASQLVITTQPPASAQSGVPFSPQPAIQLQDASGNPVSQAGVVVTASIATGAGTLGGTLTATTNASGVATFTNLSITGAAGSRTLLFTASGLTSATSSSITLGAGAATQLVITTQPAASAQSGVPFSPQPAIQLQDASGNPVSQAGVVVTASIATGAGTLGGTLTATTNASGVATFTNLSITGTAGPRTLQFTASGLTSATSGTVTISAGAASQLVITTQPPASAQSGVPFSPQPVIQVQDASNNPVSQAGVVVTASIATGAGTLGGTLTATTNASGVATFTNLTITGTAGSRTLLFSASGLTSATSSSITLGAGAATQVVITTQPATSAPSGVPFSPQPAIQLQDASNNPVSQAGVVVTASIATGGGTLGGTLTATTNASGVATFTNLSITGPTGPRTLQFAASGLTSATSGTVTITAGAATQLVIATQPPASAQSGVPFSPQPAVQLQDASGNPVSQAGVVVTASIATGAGTLGGTLTATTNASGVATFTNLAITGATGPRTLLFTASGLTSATSGTVTVSAGAASQLVITTQPAASAQSGVPFSPQPVIQLQDASGNPVSQAGVVVTASIATGGGTLGGTLTATTNASGTATFINLSITGAAGPRTLSFTASGLTSATSATVTVSAGAATQLVITTQPPTNAQSGVAFSPQPVIQLQDASSNPVSQAGVVVTASIATGGGTLGGTLTATTNASGTATFTNLSITGAAGPRTLSFTASGLTSATSATVTVSAGAATQLVITTQPPTNAQSGVAFSPQPVIQLQDASSNPVSQAGVVVTASIATGGGTLGGTLTATTNASGTATFTNLSITGAAGPRTLSFTASGLTSATSSTVTVSAGAATQLVITTQPPTNAQSGVAFTTQPVIQLQDASSNPVSQAGVVVTAALASGSGTLGGTLTATTNASGIATFTNLKINGTAGNTYTIGFTSSGLTSATSSTVTLSAGVAASLTFTQQPTSTTVSQAISPAVTVTVKDADNNVVTSPAVTVQMAIHAGTGTAGAVLGGTTSVSTVNGVATFSNLTIDRAGTAYQLDATASGVTTATSTAFDASGVPQGLAWTSTAYATTVGTPLPAGSYPKVKLTDASQNGVPNQSVSIHAVGGACATIPAGGVTATTDANGFVQMTSANLAVAAGSAASCQVTATFSALTAPAAVVVAPTNMITWLGLTDNQWSTATNWRLGAVPAPTDAVFVPAWIPTSRLPRLVANTTAGGVTIEISSGALPTLDLTGHALTVNGDVAAGFGAGNNGIVSSVGGSTVTLAKQGTASLSGNISPPTTIGIIGLPCAGMNYKVTGPTTIQSTLDVLCSLEMSAAAGLSVGGAFSTRDTDGGGTVTLSNPSALLALYGPATFDGNDETGLMTAGTISLTSDLTVTRPAAFVASGSLLLEFLGQGLQILTADSGLPSIQDLTVRNNSSLAIPTGFQFYPTVNGKLTIEGGSSIVRPPCGECSVNLIVKGVTLANAGSDLSQVSTFITESSTFPQILGNPPQTLQIDAPVTLTAPTTYTGHMTIVQPITLNGNAFTVHGGYVAIDAGSNPLDNGGFLAFNGATVTIDDELDLTGPGGGIPWANGSTGTLVLGGGLYNAETNPTTLGGSGLTVRMNGTSPQSIYFPNGASASAASLNNLLIDNSTLVDVAYPFKIGGVLNVLPNAQFKLPYAFSQGTVTVTLLSGAVLKLQSGSHFTINSSGNISPITPSNCRRYNGTPAAVVDGTNTSTVSAITSASSCTQTPTP